MHVKYAGLEWTVRNLKCLNLTEFVISRMVVWFFSGKVKLVARQQMFE
jgi:hypothetical protein